MGTQGAALHTTDIQPDGNGPSLQSVLERNDLDEFMAMAELAGQDFTAERRGQAIVVSCVPRRKQPPICPTNSDRAPVKPIVRFSTVEVVTEAGALVV